MSVTCFGAWGAFFARPLDLVTLVRGKNSKMHVVRSVWEQTTEKEAVKRHPREGFAKRGICWVGAFGACSCNALHFVRGPILAGNYPRTVFSRGGSSGRVLK